MSVLNFIWLVFQILVGYNLVLPLILYVFWSLRSKKSVEEISNSQSDYAVIVTAYIQTDMLPVVISSILRMNYSNFLVYIVADNCDITGLDFADSRVILLRPPEVLSSNTKSHFYAINNFVRPHDRLTIIDSDNLVDSEYLNALNILFNQGFEAVQGLRAAKNLNSTYSSLDAARDIYYHFFDGRILFDLKSSATLAGSGMAFTTRLYKEALVHRTIDGAGFDKVLQAEILKRDLRIAFTENAIVYDEKTSRSDQLVKQRARWINTWFKYFKFGFGILGSGFKNGSTNQLLFGLILLRPPLFIFILLSALCMVISLFISLTAFFVWVAAFIAFIAGFFIALRHGKADPRIYNSLVNVPKFIFFQIISLVKSKNANKASVATTHYFDESTPEK